VNLSPWGVPMFFVIKPAGPDGVAGSGCAAVVTLIPGVSPVLGGCLASYPPECEGPGGSAR
jgi:hypothetical protein